MSLRLIKKLADFLGPDWSVAAVQDPEWSGSPPKNDPAETRRPPAETSFEAALAALESALTGVGPLTVRVLPDTFPADLRERSGPVRDAAFKAVLALHDLRSEISYATVMEEGRAATVFWPAPPHPGRAAAFESLKAIAALPPFSLTRFAHLLLPVSEGALYHLLGHSLNPDAKPPLADGDWESLFAERGADRADPELRRLVQGEVLAAMEGYKRELDALKEELAQLRASSGL